MVVSWNILVFSYYFHFSTNEFLSFVLCSSKKSWCCSCTLGSNYSGMCLQCRSVTLSNFNVCHIMISLFFLFRYTSWIPRSGMPYFLLYLVVFMGHSVALERSVDCPLLDLFLMVCFGSCWLFIVLVHVGYLLFVCLFLSVPCNAPFCPNVGQFF